MEFENILEEPKKIKVKKKFTISLIIIAILVVLLLGIFIFLYFGNGNAKDIYMNIIDNTNKIIIESLDGAEEILSKPTSLSGNVKLEMASDDAEMKDLVDVINNMDLSYKFEVDNPNKKANYDIDAMYENANLINLAANINNNDVYINLGSLFNKDIRMDGEENQVVWEAYDFDSYKIIVDEIIKELKNNLKDEYFSEEKEMIKIDNKNVFASKLSLNLSGKDIYDIEINVLDNLKSNDKFLDSLAKLNGVTKNEIINQINSYRNELEQDDELSLKIEIYVNIFTKNVVKISVNDSGEIVHIVRQDNKEYKIINDKDSSVIGTILLEKESIKLDYNYSGEILNLEMTETEMNLNYSFNGSKINMNMVLKDNKTSYLVEVISKEDGLDVKVSLDGVMENIDKISDKINNNFVDYDKLTENDYMTIYQNVYQNQTILSLIEDIYYLDLSTGGEPLPTY